MIAGDCTVGDKGILPAPFVAAEFIAQRFGQFCARCQRRRDKTTLIEADGDVAGCGEIEVQFFPCLALKCGESEECRSRTHLSVEHNIGSLDCCRHTQILVCLRCLIFGGECRTGIEFDILAENHAAHHNGMGGDGNVLATGFCVRFKIVLDGGKYKHILTADRRLHFLEQRAIGF